MSEFKIEGDALRREVRVRVISWGAVILLFVASAVFFALGASRGLKGKVDLGLLFALTLVWALLGAIVLAFREAARLAERQMIFVLTDSEIIRKRRGYPDVKITFSEVETLTEELGRLIIKSREPGKKIAIPSEVKGYEVIRAELTKRYPLSARAKTPLKSTGLLAVCVLSWAAVVLFRNLQVVIPAAAAGLIFLALGSHRIWTVLRSKCPGWLLWGSISSAWLAAILIIYLRVLRP